MTFFKIVLFIVATGLVTSLLILGRAFTNHWENTIDYRESENNKGLEGKVIGYSLYAIAITIIIVLYLYFN